MRSIRYWLSLILWLAAFAWPVTAASGSISSTISGGGEQTSAAAAADAPGAVESVDGIAARIEDDIITESELHELAALQEVVDGEPKPRADLIKELADQWVTRGEADTAKFPRPSALDVNNAYAQLAMQFGGADKFKSRCATVGLNEMAVRRMLEQQLYLSRFLDYRFRPAAQVDDMQVEKYYQDEFAPQLKARGQQVPPLEDVQETIREVLIQREITRRANEWLEDTRGRLQIETLPEGSAK
jgi:hypothetical protein